MQKSREEDAAHVVAAMAPPSDKNFVTVAGKRSGTICRPNAGFARTDRGRSAIRIAQR